MKSLACLLAVVLAAVASMAVAPLPKPDVAAPEVAAACSRLQDALDCSVLVASKGDYGSASAFHNRGETFLLTAAHVVESSMVADPSVPGGWKFSPVSLIRQTMAKGRKSGDKSVLADVVRFSARQDFAILRSRHPGWPSGSLSLAEAGAPRIGEPVWHVGSMSGPQGANSAAEGIVSAIGRLRNNFLYDGIDGEPYDQFSINALPGSSGGGFFRKSDGKLLGVVSQFIGPGRSYGALLAVPSRTIREFCKRHKCEWAIDSTVPYPAADAVNPKAD